MRGLVGKKTKIQAAREALAAVLEEIPEGAHVALRAYGHRSPRADHNCQDTEVVFPLSPVDKAEIVKKAQALKAQGYTPIAYSLRKAMGDFRGDKAVGRAILLVSDGEETCGGDPCAVAKELEASGYDLVIHVVGFDVDPQARAQLECTAHATGGEYREARDALQLTASLKALTQRELGKPEAEEKIVPGAWFHDAPLIGEGEYSERLGVRDVHFYKVPVYQGQKVRVAGAIKKTDLKVPNGANKIPFAVKIYDADFNEATAVTLSVSGNPAEPNTFQTVWPVSRSGEAYISVSSSYDNERWADEPRVFGTNPAPSQYTLAVELPGQGGRGSTPASGLAGLGEPKQLPGGSGFLGAPTLEPGIYLGQVLMKETEYYKIPVKKGQELEVIAVIKKPRLQAPAVGLAGVVYDLKILDEERLEVAKPEEPLSYIAETPTDPGVFRARWSADYDGMAYISLGARDNESVAAESKRRPHEYTLIVKLIGEKALP
jgi:Ca-activated chloride channel family protein